MNLGSIKRGSNVFFALLQANIFKKRVPVKVALQLTTRCNLKCSYCYVNYSNYKQIKEINKNQWFKTIDELYSYGTRWLWFLGGEPILQKGLGEIIDYAKKKGMFCELNTNGILISEKNISILKKLDAMAVSIDGDEKSNDYYRGEGSYKKAINVVKLLKEAGVNVRIHSILTRRTAKTLDNVAELYKRMGVSFSFCDVLKSKKDTDHILSFKEHKKFYTKYLDYMKKGYPIIHSDQAIEYMINWPNEGKSTIPKNQAFRFSKNSYVNCVSGDLQCFYDADGKIYACNGTWDKGLDLKKVGFMKAWDYLKERDCVSCRCMGMADLHLLLGLNIKSVFYGVKSVLNLKA